MWLEIHEDVEDDVDAEDDAAEDEFKRAIMINIVNDSNLAQNLKTFLTRMINSVDGQDIPQEIMDEMSNFDNHQLLDMNFVAFKGFIATYYYGNGGAFDQQVPYQDLRSERERRGFI